MALAHLNEQISTPYKLLAKKRCEPVMLSHIDKDISYCLLIRPLKEHCTES